MTFRFNAPAESGTFLRLPASPRFISGQWTVVIGCIGALYLFAPFDDLKFPRALSMSASDALSDAASSPYDAATTSRRSENVINVKRHRAISRCLRIDLQ